MKEKERKEGRREGGISQKETNKMNKFRKSKINERKSNERLHENRKEKKQPPFFFLKRLVNSVNLLRGLQ